MDEMPSTNSVIEIPYKRYKELIAAESRLDKLEAAGVDNWEYYDYALAEAEDY